MSEIFTPGRVLAGKYRVESVLGQGGMGVVLAAWHLQLHQHVALKFLLPEAMQSQEVVQRFLREARAAVKLQSEHVARVIDVGNLETGAPYLVMELLRGHDLGALVERGERLAPTQAVDYVLQAIDAIAEAHGLGIVHRDLKPSNLFLAARSDGSTIVKVLDFGISKDLTAAPEETSLTSSGAIMGSPKYMAPEQARSTKRADTRADVWALGVILYELLTGIAPFDGETVTEVLVSILEANPTPPTARRAEIPPGLEAIILHCLRKTPEERFATVAELAVALAPFGTGAEQRCVDRATRLLRTTSSARLAVSAAPSDPRLVDGTGQTVAVGSQTGGSAWGSEASSATTRKRSNARVFVIAVTSTVFLAAAAGVAFLGMHRVRGGETHAAIDSPPLQETSAASTSQSSTPGATTSTALVVATASAPGVEVPPPIASNIATEPPRGAKVPTVAHSPGSRMSPAAAHNGAASQASATSAASASPKPGILDGRF